MACGDWWRRVTVTKLGELWMKIMSLSKDRDTHQQSYFYVVWPEDKSPGGTSTAATETTLSSSTAATDHTSSPVPSFKYDSNTIAASISSSSSDGSNQQESPVTVSSPLRKEPAVCMASEQVLTNTTGSPQISDCSHDKTPLVQHLVTSSNGTALSSSFVLHSQGPRSALAPDLACLGRPRVCHGKPGSSGAGETNLKEIGVLAKQAIANLQKIVIVATSPQSGVNVGTSNLSAKEFPPLKRKRAWDQSSGASSCMECEVKDAEINILRKRIQTLQEQIDKVSLPNGSVTFQSHAMQPPPVSEERVSQMKTLVGQLQETLPQLPEQQQVRMQQYHQGMKTSKPASTVLSNDTKVPEQSTTSAVVNESSEYVELVDGSGVFISAFKLEEATRDAKTGTQLARKLMDAFWDKDTLARSTLTPRSKFQYQQLDPKVIKSIEVYCLSHDNTLHSKDIHATMTDKCCQARSRYRSLNPQIYNSE